MENDIEKLILESLKEVINLKCISDTNKKTKNKLVYPTKRNDKNRISEQEARFLFVQKIEKKNDFFYSVEAPTKEKYIFTGKEGNERSGNFDVCLYDENKQRKHLIEFKALNPENASYNKDFVKLIKDENGLTNYFIQVINNTNTGTLPNIEKKYNEALEYAKKNDLKNQSELVIFLCVIGNNKAVYKYEVKDVKLTLRNELYKPSEIPTE